MMRTKKQPFNIKTVTPALMLCVSTLTQPQFVLAQGALLEEITVTARKREESLQDVPISVQAVTGNYIDEQGIVDFQALAPYTPNFTYTPAPGASDLYIMRGLGTSGSGAHFEPSVGQVFNGYFSTRSRMGRSALIDVAQVEVLKGPQGPIIGKNTSLGALNITSNKPTEEFESRLSAQYNFDASEGYEIEGVISGPLSDNARGRAVVNARDVDGWVKNRVTGDDLQQQDDLTLRLMLDVDFSDTFTGEFMYQRNDYDRNGKARVQAGCQEFGPFSVARAQSIGFDCRLIAENSTADIRRDGPGGTPFNSGEPFMLESDMFGATLSLDLPNFTLTSLSSFTDYQIEDTFSGDQISSLTPIGGGLTEVPGERISINNDESYEQYFQEFRINSTGLGTTQYTAGLMLFSGEMDIFQAFHSVAGAIGRPTGPAVSRNEFAASETDSIAVFEQADIQLNDEFILTLGARITNEEREGRKAQIAGEIYTSVVDTSLCGLAATGVPLAACTMGNDGSTPGGFITGDIDDTNTSFNVSLQYDVSDTSLLYATYATGFKSGGFDLRGAGDPSKFIFGEEESRNFEIGGKHTLQNGAMRLNWAIYHTEVDDLQSSANDPIIIQQIVAAADVTSQGAEVDLAWAMTENFTMSFIGAYTDSTYDDFVGSCYLGQAAAGTGCFNVDARGNGVQILDGEQTPYTPEFSFVLGGEYSVPVGTNMQLTTSARWIYYDEQYMSIERDPLGKQDSTNRIDATVSLSGQTRNGSDWNLALVGRNLSDELVFNWVNATTLSSSAIASTNLEETRFIGLRATMNW